MINLFKKDYFLLLTFYTLAHGLILLNRGLYWDDWVLYNVDKTIIIDTFRQAGHLWVGYFHSFLISFDNGIFFYRLLIFFSFLLSALFLNSILKNIKEIDSTSRFFIILFFALFPVNSVRVALIMAPYAICYFLFFFGFWLVSKYWINKNIVLRLVALPILYVSFLVNSFLMFYILILLYILYHEKDNIDSIGSLMCRALKYVDFLALPVVFWIIKITYFVPYGLYEKYNVFNLYSIWRAITSASPLVSFYTSFIEVLNVSLHSLSFILVIFAVILTLVISKQKMIDQDQNKKDIWLFAFGIFSFIIAVFPYNVLGYIPNLYDLQSRHQLLVPLGASFILYYGIKMISNGLKININGQMLIYSIVIILFINSNITNYIDHEKDWYKQLSLIENFKSNENIKNHTTFIFKDNTLDFNANKRAYRFYEYSGLMKYAFGDEKRFGVVSEAFKNMDQYKIYFNAYGNMKDYQQKEPEFQVVINHGEYDLNNINTLKLKYLQVFKHNEFQEKISQVISLETIKIDYY